MSNSATPQFQMVSTILQKWGGSVRNSPGYATANNGIAEYNTPTLLPCGHVNHHFVCSLNPDQAYIDGIVHMLEVGYGDLAGAGSVVPWFIDVHGAFYLIATGPSNHAGRGDAAVLARRQAGLPVQGPAVDFANNNDITGNAYFSGSETQHPGDSTPWPSAMINSIVMLNAAEILVMTPNSDDIGYAFNHYEWTNRKVDMSFMGGPSSSAGGDELRRRVKALVLWDLAGGTGIPNWDANGNLTNGSTPVDWIDELMATPAERQALIDDVATATAAKVLSTKVDVGWPGAKPFKASVEFLLANTYLQANSTWSRIAALVKGLTGKKG